MVIKMSWFHIIKDTQTATRSAELWVMNDFGINQNIMRYIEDAVEQGMTKDDILGELARELPNMMSLVDGFMEELTSPVNIDDTAGDGLTDVDWEEVANLFEEYIDDALPFDNT
tara:strand:- start:382 stop:723 length:342 start_codon:yes stop_codon:yes gene_type:complete